MSTLPPSTAWPAAACASSARIASIRSVVPSRTSLLSGLYPGTTQVLDNLTPARYALPDFVTLPQHLRSHGYSAASAGKVFHQLDPATPDHAAVATSLRGFMQPKSGAPKTLEDFRIASDAISLMNGFHAAGKPFFLAVGFRRPMFPSSLQRRCSTGTLPAVSNYRPASRRRASTQPRPVLRVGSH